MTTRGMGYGLLNGKSNTGPCITGACQCHRDSRVVHVVIALDSPEVVELRDLAINK